MLAVDDWLGEGEVDAQMVMQVHDELVLEIVEDQVASASAQLCRLMSDAASLNVPLVVEAGVGDNWDEAH
jgi:DNA polymerase-1